MEPSRGASTWAFGNHKWVKYIGIFTKNAMVISKMKLFLNIKIFINMNDELFFIKIMVIIKGNDAIIVYINK